MIVTPDALRSSDPAAYDLCIVGAGAAGITLALRMAARGRRVCILEAGGESYSAEAQRLAEGTVEGDPYPPLRSTRMTVLGGTTQVWAGWCRPLDPIDFEPRSDLGKAGWPFGRATLMPYYRQAHQVCGLGPFDYDAVGWSERLGEPPLLKDGDDLVHSMFHVSSRRFGTHYRRELARLENLHLILQAPVTMVDVDEAGAVRGVLARLPGGEDVAVRAQWYVLAAGGIENARLLLTSTPTPERAPGNAHGLVGRYFSDHPFINPGTLVLHGAARRLGLYFPARRDLADGGGVRATLALPERVRERERLPGCALFFHPRYEAHATFASPDVRAFLELREKLRSRAVPGACGPLISQAARGPHRIAAAVLRKLLVRDGPTARWRLRLMFETAARPENRVLLSDEHDALGRPRAVVRWRVGNEELVDMRRTLALFDHAFRRAGVGHVERALPEDDDAWRAALEGGKHHMGTTRMHTDPAAGVVDGDSRVHGTRNLFVAGSSVFPSGGYANPTLTIVALALRLADHLVSLEDGRGDQ
jgi:choline dehydrogenase-like flavoprotein